MRHLVFTMLALFMLSAVGLTSGCKKKEEKKGCKGFTTLSGEVQVNGESMLLIGAQSFINSIGGTDKYVIQINAMDNDCNTTHTMSFTIEILSGTTLGGVYPFKDFFSAGSGDAYGDYVVQVINPISQSLKNITSGSVSVENKGNDNFDFDINANLAGGGNVTMKASHKF